MKKFRNSKWALAIVPVVLSFLLSLLADWIKQVEIFSTIKTIATTLWKWMLAFLNFEVKVWWILVFLVCLVILLWIIAKVADTKEKNQPKFLQYTEDHFRDWKWSWTWGRTYTGKWQVENLIAHCPQCDTPMRHDNFDTVFHCSRCSYESDNHSDNRDDVMVVIYDNVDRMMKTEK